MERCDKEEILTDYIFETETGMFIDGGPMGNHTRFINHSCNENCEAKFLAVNQVIILAVKDIEKNKEILLNYGKDYFMNLTCLCGEDNCFKNENILENMKIKIINTIKIIMSWLKHKFFLK